MGGGSGQEGIRFMATFTYSFGKGDKPAKLPPPGSGPRRPAIGHFTSTTSEAIAARIDGPEFESEVPGRGPQSNLSTFLPDLVATVIDKMILAAHDGKDRVDIEMPLGDIPIPSGLSIGLQRMVDAIVATDPKLMGGFQQVGFLIYQTPKDQKDLRSARLGDLVKIIPVRPSLAH